MLMHRAGHHRSQAVASAVSLSMSVWMLLGAALGTRLVGADPTAWSWREPQATVTPTGDLLWAPKPFRFEAGASVRYIDFAQGDDANPGDVKAKPWKHHPWDANATGVAKAGGGVHTYVFKRGVVYRGDLVTKESGTAGEPIRLTSDPAWGKGEAVICGSEKTSGWTKGKAAKGIPEPDKVWSTALDFAPRTLWMVAKDGAITRIPLARTPNWTADDPDDVKSGWWTWNYPTGKTFDVYTDDKRLKLGVDTAHITQAKEYYQDAILWSEFGWVMGTPYPSSVQRVDVAKHSLAFDGLYGGPTEGRKIIKNCRYYLEDKPEYLDDPKGEFWFEKSGDGGRLYLRLPGDADPNGVDLEAGKRLCMIDSKGMSHVHISGLSFRFTNRYWDIAALKIPECTSCIGLEGSGTDLRVSNCLFEHVNQPISMNASAKDAVIDRVEISDNDFRFTDGGGIDLNNGWRWGDAYPAGRLDNVAVLRNRMVEIGQRPARVGNGHALSIAYAERAEIAGNILDRVYGAGIFLFGGKANGTVMDCPYALILAHHNKVTNSLLNNCDWGGIETWQGGPCFVYDNISGNPGGYNNFHLPFSGGSARFGHAYYLDGGFKNYYFNNIAWGKNNDPDSPLCNTSAFQEIISYQNSFFNNTAYNFFEGSRRQAPQAGRNKYLGNVWASISGWTFWHAQPAKTAEAANAKDAGAKQDSYAIDTDAFGSNVFSGITGQMGCLEPNGQWLKGVPEFTTTLAAHAAMRVDAGVMSDTALLPGAAKNDFRLGAGSAAIGKGVKVFVPWALYGITGEWNFCQSGADPSRILDEHWYLTPYHIGRDSYLERPMYSLTAVNVKAGDYVPGPLEDWTAGALKLNGRDQYAVLANADMSKPFAYDLASSRREFETQHLVASGDGLKSPAVSTSDFLIEAYFQTVAGHVGGVVIEKLGAAGYSLAVDKRGGVTLAVVGADASASVASKATINDGGWHHVIAECDRAGKVLTIYVDGKKDAQAPGIDQSVSLASEADLHVGGTPTGRCLAGTLDFLRIGRGTLANARTTIEELTAWEFDGPFLRDFTGKKPKDGKRDAGAIQFAP